VPLIESLYDWRVIDSVMARTAVRLKLMVALGVWLVAAPPLLAAEAPPTGLADSAALRATIYGTPAQDVAPLPGVVPLEEINIALPWARPLPKVLWFDRRLRVWLSAQKQPAPLAIVISGTGSDGNTAKLSLLRAVLYGAGYHVLTMPSPTFPGFIASASSTGVAGDLMQDGRDLYDAAREVIAHLPARVKITRVDVVGYSLGGANAAVMKFVDSRERKLNIRRAVMIDPPVSLFASIDRLDRLFKVNIGAGNEGIDRLYRRLYVRMANFYRSSERVHIEDTDLLAAAAAVLRTDADFSAAIALTFRITLMNMFYVGDLYAGTGIVVDPQRLPQPSDPTSDLAAALRDKPFTEYFDKVYGPYYMARRPGATRESLIAANRLEVIGDALRDDPDYFAQTNADDVILDQAELEWLQRTLGNRIAVYEHGGHLGNLGSARQVADMLEMLAGRWSGAGR
jgi:pimeloyl-ACP methyl ester carboxylesterase